MFRFLQERPDIIPCPPGNAIGFWRSGRVPSPRSVVDFPHDETWIGNHRLPPLGRLRREVAPRLAVAVARTRAGRRRRPLFPQCRKPVPGARVVPRDPIRRGSPESPPDDRRRPGGGASGAIEGSAVHLVPTRPRLLPLLLPERGRGRSRRRGDRRRTPRRGDRRELRPGPRRGQQPGQPGDRGPCLFRRPGRRGRPRDRVRQGIALPGDPPRRKTFPRARRHLRRLPLRPSRRPGGEADAPSPRTAPLPPRRARRDPGDHDRARHLPGPRPRAPGHPVPRDSPRPAEGEDAVPGGGHLRRAGDEGDRGSLRHRGGGGPRRDGRVRRRARVPGGKRTGGGDRTAGPGGYRSPGVPSGGSGSGRPDGKGSRVGGGERTLSSGAAGGGSGAASASFFTSAGGLGKYRANISGR